MFLKLCVFLVLYTDAVKSQHSCSDCIKIKDCQNAQHLLKNRTPDNENKLRNAFCGFEGKFPRVCCVELHPNINQLPKDCGNYDGNRVIGGNETVIHEYPWMALIAYDSRGDVSFKCGGTVINSRYILTAAHCIKGSRIVGVRIGEHDTSVEGYCQGAGSKLVCEEPYQDMEVEEEIMHEGYQGKPKVRNDIGLLRLKNKIDFKPKNAKPICLPVTINLRERNIGQRNATIAGWGFTETGYTSTKLLSANVPVYTKKKCSDLYNKGPNRGTDETENKICAGANGKDSCGGDSGGPLMLTGRYYNVDRYIQHGIVSYGPRLCGSDYPGVYTDVAKYMGWILDNIRP